MNFDNLELTSEEELLDLYDDTIEGGVKLSTFYCKRGSTWIYMSNGTDGYSFYKTRCLAGCTIKKNVFASGTTCQNCASNSYTSC